MHAFALSSANPGRLRPSFFLLMGACGLAHAQQPVTVIPHSHTQQLALLKVAVERSHREIESLQREMLRRSQASSAT